MLQRGRAKIKAPKLLAGFDDSVGERGSRVARCGEICAVVFDGADERPPPNRSVLLPVRLTPAEREALRAAEG